MGMRSPKGMQADPSLLFFILSSVVLSIFGSNGPMLACPALNPGSPHSMSLLRSLVIQSKTQAGTHDFFFTGHDSLPPASPRSPFTHSRTLPDKSVPTGPLLWMAEALAVPHVECLTVWDNSGYFLHTSCVGFCFLSWIDAPWEWGGGWGHSHFWIWHSADSVADHQEMFSDWL